LEIKEKKGRNEKERNEGRSKIRKERRTRKI
jgi:hypothetical protein